MGRPPRGLPGRGPSQGGRHAASELLSPWSPRDEPFDWQGVHRFCGWAAALSGTAYAIVWLCMPIDRAKPLAAGTKSWRLSKVETFVVLGAGQSRIESGHSIAAGFPGRGIDLERFSASLGAGAKIGLGAEKRLGVRFEVRGFWVNTPAELMEGIFGMSGGDFTQIQMTTGLSIKI